MGGGETSNEIWNGEKYIYCHIYGAVVQKRWVEVGGWRRCLGGVRRDAKVSWQSSSFFQLWFQPTSRVDCCCAVPDSPCVS